MHRTPIVLAAVGAVAATSVAVAALSGPERPTAEPRRQQSTPISTPTSSPTTASVTPSRTRFEPVRDHDWLTTVPVGLSVSTGLPDAGGDFERVSEPVTWTFCGDEAFPETDVLDARRDGATGPEYADRRDLRVFADDRRAHAFLTSAADVAANCPEEQHGATLWLHTATPVDAVGEESMRLVETYETDGMVNAGATWWDVTRIGNAVLVNATGGEYLPGETLGPGIREQERLLAPVVASMCVFSAKGCPSDDPRGWSPPTISVP